MRHKAGEHPSATMLLLGASGLALSLLLVAVHKPLIGELVAGLAVLPLIFAVYLRLLVDIGSDGYGGWGRPGDDDKPEPPRPGKPGDGVDWDRFEREFWGHVNGRVPVA